MRMKLARLFPAIALVGLFVTACGGGTGGSPTPSANVPSDLSISSFTADFSYMSKLTNLTASGKGMVGVILPDTTSSTRYVAFDDPYLRKAAQMAGYTVGTNFKIDNAQGNEQQELSIAQADITAGGRQDQQRRLHARRRPGSNQLGQPNWPDHLPAGIHGEPIDQRHGRGQ